MVLHVIMLMVDTLNLCGVDVLIKMLLWVSTVYLEYYKCRH